jgi:hypothetical protein
MDVPPGTGVTSETARPQAAMLRRAWFEVAATAAPQLADLPLLLDARLTDLAASGRLDEPSLLPVAEEASQYALEQGAGEVARTLSKRLRRAIYEFLLALDAVNPAELTPTAAAPAAPPAPAADPRVPVALMPDDVQGGDTSTSTAASGAVEAIEAPPVPLWEQMSTPAPARQVYRVASREVTPVTDAAPTEVEAAEPEASQVGPDAEAAVPESEPDAPAAEAYPDIEAVVADVFDGAAQDVEGESSMPEAVADAGPDAALHLEEVEAATELQAEVEEPVAELSEPVAEVQEPVAVDEAPAAEAESPVELAASESDEILTWDTSSAPVSTWAPVVDVPPAAAESGPVPNGVKPPRDLLRVPRQFRRLPPLPGRPQPDVHDEGETVLPGEPDATAWTSLPAEPAVTAEPDADATPHDIAGTAAAFPDDDALGVPALPWPVEPTDETTAAEPLEAEAPAIDEEPEEEMGLPFAPLAEFEVPTPIDAPSAEVEAPAPMPAAEAAAPLPEAPAAEAAAPLPEAPAAEPALPVAEPVASLPEAPAPAEPAPLADPFVDPFAAPPVPESYGLPDLPAPAAPADPTQATVPWTPVPIAPSAAPFPIAPREGFHLTDPGALDLALGNDADTLPRPPIDNPFTAAIPPVNVPPSVHIAQPAPPAPAASAPTADHQGDDDPGAWRVRQSPRAQLLAERMAQKRREEAARAAFEAASVHDDAHGRKRRRGEEPLPDLPTARRHLDEHLRKKRGAEAGALLQRLAQELGGREIADLALDSGDRCRALGQSRSATNCYLAAWRADPLYETPLWRLSDICLNEQEIDLAVGYLERIADLMRSRGDDEGAIGVYRKIAMIAPERQDVRDVIRLAKTTGRLDV